jgi:hypothetical protein
LALWSSCQEVHAGVPKIMNLVQMRFVGLLKAYVLDLNAPMNATPKINNFAKKCIFLGEKEKFGGEHLI